MTGLLLFCAFMAVVYVPFLDFLRKPVESDTEVWLGLPLHGVWAKATEPLHMAIYGAGAWGFWKMRRWMHPWAAVYSASVAIGMLIWAATDPRDVPRLQLLGVGAAGFALFGGLTVALWRARERFSS